MRVKPHMTVIDYLGLRRSDGFNMLELMITILIIAILVGIAVPVLLCTRKKADRVTAEYNLEIGGGCLNRVWVVLADNGVFPDGIAAYRDCDPPDSLKLTGAYQSNGWVPVDAQYLSNLETKINWVDLSVTGVSEPIAYAGGGNLKLATEEHGFRILGVWKGGQQLMGGEEILQDWSIIPGKIGAVEDQYYWDGRWQDNTDNSYVTLITLERNGTAHYMTFKQGSVVSSGTFNWDNGEGYPGNEDEGESDDPGDDPDDPGDDPDDPGDDPDDPGDDPDDPGDDPDDPGDDPDDPGEEPVVVSGFEIKPETLNLSSNGHFNVSINLSLLGGYTASDIDPNSAWCSGAYCTDVKLAGNKVILKFERQNLLNVQVGDEVELFIGGSFYDGNTFGGSDTIRIIDQGN